eukprot:scaffold17950_cov78-Isochrysis_galbana.AAC.1
MAAAVKSRSSTDQVPVVVLSPNPNPVAAVPIPPLEPRDDRGRRRGKGSGRLNASADALSPSGAAWGGRVSHRGAAGVARLGGQGLEGGEGAGAGAAVGGDTNETGKTGLVAGRGKSGLVAGGLNGVSTTAATVVSRARETEGAEKAAAEKAAAENATTEKATTEKAAAEKAATEKAATEKATTEKAAAEKATTEKAAAEKAAAETVAAEKAARAKIAGKIAEEKVAADKIAADKIAAEKIAEEKMAAEKMAAEKIAAQKAAASIATAEKAAAVEAAAAAKAAAMEKAAAAVEAAAVEKAAAAAAETVAASPRASSRDSPSSDPPSTERVRRRRRKAGGGGTSPLSYLPYVAAAGLFLGLLPALALRLRSGAGKQIKSGDPPPPTRTCEEVWRLLRCYLPTVGYTPAADAEDVVTRPANRFFGWLSFTGALGTGHSVNGAEGDSSWAVRGGDGFAPMEGAVLAFSVQFDDEDEKGSTTGDSTFGESGSEMADPKIDRPPAQNSMGGFGSLGREGYGRGGDPSGVQRSGSGFAPAAPRLLSPCGMPGSGGSCRSLPNIAYGETAMPVAENSFGFGSPGHKARGTIGSSPQIGRGPNAGGGYTGGGGGSAAGD